MNLTKSGLKPSLSVVLLLMVLIFFHLSGYSQTTIKGTVNDGSNFDRPLVSVNVIVKGTKLGTSTNNKGEFILEVPSPNDTLIFSFVGYHSKEVPLDGLTELSITLEPNTVSSEEVVVVGYGRQTKESVVGAVSTISGEKLQQASSTGNLLSALQGSAPGVTVFTTGETPGAESVQIQLRAATSMNNNNPLFIVDGVEVPSITNIDPLTVQTVSVLKGASATAVYGVKAANGVIIIETIRGTKDRISLDLSTETTLKQPWRLPKFMDSYNTMLLRNEAYKNDQQWNLLIPDEDLQHYKDQDAPYLYPDYDWNKFLWKSAWDQKYNVNARGGNDFVRYFASLSYLQQGDIMNTQGMKKIYPYEVDATYWSKRFNFTNNLDFNITPTTVFSTQLNSIIQNWNSPVDDYTQELMFQPVTSMPFYPEDALSQYPDDIIPYNQSGVRPFIDPTKGSNVRLLWTGGAGARHRQGNSIAANLVLKQDLDFITKGLGFRALYSYQSSQNYLAQDNLNVPGFYGYYLNPADTTWSRYDATGNRDFNTPQPHIAIQQTRNLSSMNRSHYYQLQLNYNRSFGNHSVGLTTVFSRRQSRGVADFPHFEEDYIARGEYNFKKKYFVESSVAYTGSESFAPGLRFGTFPSFGIGWILSKEDFFKNMPSWINYAKLKYSWGEVGSDAGIPRWLYQTFYQPNTGSVSLGNPPQSRSVISEGDIPVPDATWETAVKQNLGLEMELFNNELTLNFEVYKERRTNILMARNSVPTWLGISGSVFSNIGETKAHGLELSLGYRKNFGRDFGININGQISASESRVIKWDESELIPFHLKAEGKPVDIAMRMSYLTPLGGLQTKGFYQNFDELFIWPRAAGGMAPIVGDLRFLDFNGDGALNSLDNVVEPHPFVPNMNWNVDLGFRYKQWTIDFVFYGISPVESQLRLGGMFFLYPFTQNKDEAMTIHGDHWTPDNTNPQFPAVHSDAEHQYNYRISSFSILDLQYVSLKRAILGYNLQANALKDIGINQIQFSLTGINLLLWTKLPFGGAPEGANYGQDFGSYPISRRFSLSAVINFKN